MKNNDIGRCYKEILDCFTEDGSINVSECKPSIRWFLETLPTCQKFYLPEFGTLNELTEKSYGCDQGLSELPRLPYDEICIYSKINNIQTHEVDARDRSTGGPEGDLEVIFLLSETTFEGERAYNYKIVFNYTDSYSEENYIGHIEADGVWISYTWTGGFTFEYEYNRYVHDDKQIKGMCYQAWNALTLIIPFVFNEKSTTVFHKGASLAVNKRRMRDGKVPFFSYNHVEITNKPRVVIPHQGGTHASPRFHTRRGHYRHYKSGKVVWVNDTKVGSAKRGIVMKDYSYNPTDSQVNP
jgi:hypothetical protein